MAAITVKALRLASAGICLIVAVSFVLFAIDQTSTASGQQQNVVSEKPRTGVASTRAPGQAPGPGSAHAAHASGFRAHLDEIAFELTSPVAGVVKNSEWLDRTVRLLFALLVYGFGLGYLVRAIRVRV